MKTSFLTVEGNGGGPVTRVLGSQRLCVHDDTFYNSFSFKRPSALHKELQFPDRSVRTRSLRHPCPDSFLFVVQPTTSARSSLSLSFIRLSTTRVHGPLARRRPPTAPFL